MQEQQSRRPKHAEFGYYELEPILDSFRQRGFAVTCDVRPKGMTLAAAANQAIERVRELRAAGVPPRRITLLGASMGSSVALLASVKLRNPELNFALLGACLSLNVPLFVAEHGHGPAGRILAIREKSDSRASLALPGATTRARARSSTYARSCSTPDCAHGFLYRPLPEWVDPVVEWASLR